MFTKLSREELIQPGIEKTIPFSSKKEGAEQILIQAMQANQKYSKAYRYSDFPQINNIADMVAGSNSYDSMDFARNVYVFQNRELKIPEGDADGQFDPPLIEFLSKRFGVDISPVIAAWRAKLNKNWMGHRWTGRRLQEKKGEPGIVVYRWPLKSAQIVGDFTGSTPSDKNHAKGHWGMDLGNVPEGTPVFPVAPGKIKGAGDYGKGGNGVLIDHGNGTTSYYAHMKSINVKSEDEVDFDDIIGTVGKTGNARGSVHLHFEIKSNGTKMNPKNIIGKPVDAQKRL